MKSYLKINGSKYLYQAPFTVLDVINYLGFNTKLIVVDLNGFVLKKQLWETTNLKNQDALEILSIAGGG